MRLPASPFPPVGTVAAPCGSPAVPHLRRYYGFVRLLAYPFLPPPVSLGGRYSSLRVYSLPWGRPCFPGTWFYSGRAEPVSPGSGELAASRGFRGSSFESFPRASASGDPRATSLLSVV